jgi:DNA-binding transcriptional MerR regulator
LADRYILNLATSVKVKSSVGGKMRIGELAKKTGVPARMLRYYEEQGLISPRRLDNGYREYDDYLVDRVGKIRGLVDSGIPTRIVSDILPCLDKPQTIVVRNADPELRELLVQERDRMSQKIDFLIQNRDSITRYIRALDDAASLAHEPRAS